MHIFKLLFLLIAMYLPTRHCASDQRPSLQLAYSAMYRSKECIAPGELNTFFSSIYSEFFQVSTLPTCHYHNYSPFHSVFSAITGFKIADGCQR